MATEVLHISDVEAARDFAALLERVRGGAEVVIENNRLAVAVLSAPLPPRRTIAECIALLPKRSPATVDEDFPGDLAAAIAAAGVPVIEREERNEP
jgi:antitoxin (DNA-binding transcriptional repressor) of toxin-antitoxin stability system